ncbi:MAG: glycosyl transferase [Planctomycetota bacterium]|nr:MAG: glycosyl transferase [Planctomycetota bacterium]
MIPSDSPFAAPIQLSVILPCFNEAGCLEELVHELNAVLDNLPLTSEILLIDDASEDSTRDVALDLRARLPRVRLGLHAARCGQSAAFATGLSLARGELLAMLDADGQADPRDFPRLLHALGAADAVCGVRRERHDGALKRLASKVGNGVRKLVTRDPTTDAGCTFRVLRAQAARELPAFNGLHRFLPALLRMQGFAVVECPVTHRPRTAGLSKYGIRDRMFRGLVDCFVMLWFRRRSFPARRCVGEPGALAVATPTARVLVGSVE